MPKIEHRKSIHDNLIVYCHLAKADDYIEITEWTDGEGFDVNINEREMFSLTWGEFSAIKKLIKQLEKDNSKNV